MADHPPDSINLPQVHTLAALAQMTPVQRQTLIEEANNMAKNLINYTVRNQTKFARLLTAERHAAQDVERWVQIAKRGRELLQEGRGRAQVYQNSPSGLHVNRITM